jgi:hypothetical protein
MVDIHVQVDMYGGGGYIKLENDYFLKFGNSERIRCKVMYDVWNSLQVLINS